MNPPHEQGDTFLQTIFYIMFNVKPQNEKPLESYRECQFKKKEIKNRSLHYVQFQNILFMPKGN